MFIRLALLSTIVLVAIPESVVAPGDANDLDTRAFCERNTSLCRAPQDILREVSRKSWFLAHHLMSTDMIGSQAIPTLPLDKSSAVNQVQSLNKAAERLGEAARQTLNQQDLSAPWRGTATPHVEK